jgi:hypothetical protein
MGTNYYRIPTVTSWDHTGEDHDCVNRLADRYPKGIIIREQA